MKNRGYFLSVIVLLIIGSMAFTLEPSERQNVWTEWQQTACYKGLDYRVKKGNYSMSKRARKWQIQFKSRYSLTLHFNYKAISAKRIKDVRKIRANNPRIYLEANSVSKELTSFVKANTSLYIHVNKARFGSKDVGKNFYPCDVRKNK